MANSYSDADIFGSTDQASQSVDDSAVMRSPTFVAPAPNQQSGQQRSPSGYSDDEIFGAPQNVRAQQRVQNNTGPANLDHGDSPSLTSSNNAPSGGSSQGSSFLPKWLSPPTKEEQLREDPDLAKQPWFDKPLSWKGAGQEAAYELKKTGQAFLEPIAREGAIVRGWGADAPGTKKFDFTDPQDYLAMGLPLIPGAKNTAALGEDLINAGPAVARGVGKAAQAPGEIASVVKRGYNATSPEDLQAESQDMWKNANPYYTGMRKIGATYHPDSINELTTSIGNALQKQDILPEYAPVTTDVASKIAARAEQGDLSLNHLDQYRAQLKDATGKDASAASVVRKAIDNHVNNTTGDDLLNGSPEAVGLLNRARAEYTRAANFDDVSTILQKTGGDPQKIKTRLTNFLADPDNTAGMEQNELDLLRRASKMSSLENMTKMFGKLGITIVPTGGSGNGILPYLMATGDVAGKTAGSLLVPGGPALVAAGTAAKAGNTLYGRGLAENALDAIRTRPMPSTDYRAPAPYPQLEAPPIYTPRGGFGAGETQGPPQATPTLRLPRGGSDPYYQPQGRALTYQPRADYEVTPEGFAQRPSNIAPPAASPEDSAVFQRAGQNAADRNVKRLQLTYQPRADFIGTNNGIVQPPRNLSTDPFLLGEDAGMPMPLSEATKVNPKWPQQARGGGVKQPHKGRVAAKPKSYNTLSGRKA